VQWCRAVTVAAGEAYKGCRLDEVPNDRAATADIRERALDDRKGDI
jgi:hypothetical protein